jgi:flagellin
VGAGGTTYAISAAAAGGSVAVSSQDLASALVGELRSTFTDSQFIIGRDGGGALTLQNRTAGAGAANVTGLGYAIGNASATAATLTGTPGTDTAYTVDKGSFTVFTGGNAEQAVFAVNGQKFALVKAGDTAVIGQMADRDVQLIDVSTTSASALTATDLQRITATVNQKTGMALETDGNDISLKAPRTGAALRLQVGDTADAYNQMTVSIGDMSSRSLGLGTIDLSSAEGASRALSSINAAVERVSSTRGDLGALQNRLSTTAANLETASENLAAAESRIRDTDMAKMIMEFTKRSILSQAGQAVLAQANLQSQQVLQLLR